VDGQARASTLIAGSPAATGDPVLVRTRDFKDKTLGKVNPYGVSDLALDEGWVSVGIDADTAQFAVASIRSWWRHLGHGRYPDATTLTITANCGGSNGNSTVRCSRWGSSSRSDTPSSSTTPEHRIGRARQALQQRASVMWVLGDDADESTGRQVDVALAQRAVDDRAHAQRAAHGLDRRSLPSVDRRGRVEDVGDALCLPAGAGELAADVGDATQRTDQELRQPKCCDERPDRDGAVGGEPSGDERDEYQECADKDDRRAVVDRLGPRSAQRRAAGPLVAIGRGTLGADALEHP